MKIFIFFSVLFSVFTVNAYGDSFSMDFTGIENPDKIDQEYIILNNPTRVFEGDTIVFQKPKTIHCTGSAKKYFQAVKIEQLQSSQFRINQDGCIAFIKYDELMNVEVIKN